MTPREEQRMNIHQRLLFISTFYQVMQKISSDHVLPIFAGLWYETAEYQESDSCGREIFNYGELFSSPADLVISKFSPDCACDYSSISSYYNFTSMPYGFISMNSNDWKEIIAQPDAALAGEYEIHCANCLSQTSGFPISSESRLKSWYQVMALPFYDCPPYTRLSYDNITYEIGCTTNPTPCLADIIARDLTIPGLESCGHVGLIATYEDSTPSVIEVLNDDPSGIFINPLYGNDSFTSKSSFWGERYGLENATRISMELATNIIEVGIEQSYYDFSYAYSWDYYPGGSENHTEDCKFRCDSFVYYCYEYVGLNIQNTFAYPTSPRTIFSDFICSSNPIGNCQTYITDHIQTPSNITNNDELCIFEGKNRNENTKRQPFHDIFSKLRPILRKESSQKEHLQKLIEMFLSIENFKMRELFVRCLCFEINNMSSTQFSYTVKPLLSQVLWQYQYLLNV